MPPVSGYDKKKLSGTPYSKISSKLNSRENLPRPFTNGFDFPACQTLIKHYSSPYRTLLK